MHLIFLTLIVLQVYNASNNELVRTNTLVKGAIIQIDATPFRQWYEAHVSSDKPRLYASLKVLGACSMHSPSPRRVLPRQQLLLVRNQSKNLTTCNASWRRERKVISH